MTPFMQLVADDLYEKMNGNFQNTTIIFPNKRASLFFSEYLWKKAGGKPIWAPDYTTISDLFASLSRYTHADPIYLALRLFDIFKKVMPADTKTIDQAYPLMEMMLSDFQDIDNNMVDPEKLFVNIADMKEMTDFSFLTDQQREALESFFGHFLDTGEKTSQLKSKFLSLWNNLHTIYQHFRESLLRAEEQEKAAVYEGMMKRLVIEALASGDKEAKARIDSRLSSATYVVVGFNVLVKTEVQLFKYLKSHRDTKFYWDYDEVYTQRNRQTRMQSKYEAGQFIIEDIKTLGSEFKDASIYSNMRKRKQIRFIQSPTNNAQVRYLDHWISQALSDGRPPRETAVILCDENLLQPVLHSIPAATPVNVTMGYPLSGTPIFSLIQALIDLQMTGSTITGAWRYKQAAAVMQHPLMQKAAGRQCTELLSQMRKENIAFPSPDMFAGHEILARVFQHVSGARLTEYLIEMITIAGKLYQHISGSADFTVQMQKEAIFTAYTCINRLRLTMAKQPSAALSTDTTARLLLQLLKGATIPFHGEPVSGLQVMGLLETRNLDFRNIIMLSVNEGQMPKSDKRPSLIPYTLRAAFGMTTIEREVSLYAYYYYRLMQRAENVTMVYNSSTEGGSKGEMSRFMLQTLAEAGDLLSPDTHIDMRAFTSQSATASEDTLMIEKTPEVMERLRQRYDADTLLSPSALKRYIQCPLLFYFRYVAGLNAEDEVSDDIDSPMLGTIYHYTMQKLYEPYTGKSIASSTLQSMGKNKGLILQTINNAIAVLLFHHAEKDAAGHTINYGGANGRPLLLNGKQLINREVVRIFADNQIDTDMRMAQQLEAEGGSLKILGMETKHTTTIEVDCEGDMAEKKKILIGGFIDRTDCLASPQGDTVRIIDYKTGRKANTACTIEEMFDPDRSAGCSHIFQTFYYALVLGSKGSPYAGMPIAPALMYCAKKAKEEDKKPDPSAIVKWKSNAEGAKRGSVEVTDFMQMCGDEYEDRLKALIKEIFSNDAQHRYFTQCDDEQRCAFCDFTNICGKHPQKQAF